MGRGFKRTEPWKEVAWPKNVEDPTGADKAADVGMTAVDAEISAGTTVVTGAATIEVVGTNVGMTGVTAAGTTVVTAVVTIEVAGTSVGMTVGIGVATIVVTGLLKSLASQVNVQPEGQTVRTARAATLSPTHANTVRQTLTSP